MTNDHLLRVNRSGITSIVGSHHHYNHLQSNIANRASSTIYRIAIIVVAFFLFIYYISTNDQTFGLSSTVRSSSGNSNDLESKSKKGIDQLKPDGQLCQEGDAFRYFVSNTQTQARCIDGSRPAFYLRKGHGEGKYKWFVFFEGGGWCFDHKSCSQRAMTNYGTSRLYPRCLAKQSMKDYLSSESHHNPLTYNWNVVHVKYCDGTSYASDAEVVYEGKKLFFRGKHNRDETIKSLLSLGMKDAHEVLIGGCSAGALAVYLGLDEMAGLIHEQNPTVHVRGVAFSGFFAEYSANEIIPSNGQTMRDDGVVDGKLDYASALRNVFLFSNMTAGANKRCLHYQTTNVKRITGSTSYGKSNNSDIYPNIPESNLANCAFASNLAPHIRTPVFSLQPQYDQWQILHVLGRNYSVSSVNEFGRKLSQELLKGFHYDMTTSVDEEGIVIKTMKNPGHGSFIDSCAHHCTSCSVEEDTWSGNKFLSNSPDKFTPAVAIKIWYKSSIPSYNYSYIPLSEYTNGTSFGLKIASNSMLFLQDFPFPCHKCCKCTVRSLPYVLPAVQSN